MNRGMWLKVNLERMNMGMLLRVGERVNRDMWLRVWKKGEQGYVDKGGEKGEHELHATCL